MRKILLILAVVVLAGIGVALVINSKDTDKSTSSGTNNNQTNNDFGSSQTIIYDDVGFSPQKLTSKSGEKVTIQNKSSNLLQLESDPHPQHTDNPELNVGTVAPGQSETFTLTTKGTFGFHNHLNPSDAGIVVVQ